MFSPPRELLRFRSAPCSMLESLLQESEPGFQNQGFDNLVLSAATGNPFAYGSEETQARVFPNHLGFETENSGSGLGLFRQSSSPAELIPNFDLSENPSESLFPDFDFSQPSVNKKARKREDLTVVSTRISGQLKEEEEHGSQLTRGVSSDLEMEKLWEESVPCRVRAKRGCATHPRSIAERVRRTRISDRIRKLQELVPNMDKQSNTADMLDEAVEYVKLLQKQVKELSEYKQKCKCFTKSYSDSRSV